MSCKWYIANRCTNPNNHEFCIRKLRDCDYEEDWEECSYCKTITVSRKVYAVYCLDGIILRLCKLFEELSDAEDYCNELKLKQKKLPDNDDDNIEYFVSDEELLVRRVNC